MGYFVWRSDSPANAAWFESIEAGHRAMREAMARIHDRRIEWCLVKTFEDDRDWQTVVCGRHGDLV